METAEQMGVKHGTPKQKCLSEDSGTTAQSISVTKGKRCWVHSDPYTGGKRSGKHAKPDATSATVNACAHTCAMPVTVLLHGESMQCETTLVKGDRDGERGAPHRLIRRLEQECWIDTKDST